MIFQVIAIIVMYTIPNITYKPTKTQKTKNLITVSTIVFIDHSLWYVYV